MDPDWTAVTEFWIAFGSKSPSTAMDSELVLDDGDDDDFVSLEMVVVVVVVASLYFLLNEGAMGFNDRRKVAGERSPA